MSCGRRGAPYEEHDVTFRLTAVLPLILIFHTFNIFHILFNIVIRNLLYLSKVFQHCQQFLNIVFNCGICFFFRYSAQICCFQLFHCAYYYGYNKLYIIDDACKYTRVRARFARACA